MKVSVVIPSLGRDKELRTCLSTLNKQTHLPDEVIVISDGELEKGDYSFKLIEVKTPDATKISATLNSGINLATGEIICFTDPDTLAPPDWIEKFIKIYKANPLIGGVGGRDQIYKVASTTLETSRMSWKPLLPQKVRRVGKLSWFGRIVGNHHELLDKAQEVDFLKGCNMSFRRSLISTIDERVVGFYRWEQDLCLQTTCKGYKLWYDPEICITHMTSRRGFSLQDLYSISHNTTYILLKYFPWCRRISFLFYAFLVGQRNNLGLLRGMLFPWAFRSLDELATCLLGKTRGVATFFHFKRLTFE